MTREEAARIGMELRRVVQTQSFEKCIEVLQQQYHAEVFNSTPDEVQRRERAYAQANALNELLITFNTFIAIAESEALEVDEDHMEIFE